MQCRSHSRGRTSECLFVTAYSMDEYAEEDRTEKNLIVRSGMSEAETTRPNNKRLRSTFCIEAIQTRSIARPFCDSRASCSFSVQNVISIFRRIPSFRGIECKWWSAINNFDGDPVNLGYHSQHGRWKRREETKFICTQ